MRTSRVGGLIGLIISHCASRHGISVLDIKENLEELYCIYNHREFIHPDPLEFLYAYGDIRDGELVGLIASSLAYGRVAQILKSVSTILKRMAPSPFSFLQQASRDSLCHTFGDFKHRFTGGQELSDMLIGIKLALDRYGSLHACFAAGMKEEDDTVIPALSAFVEKINAGTDGRPNSLIPSPKRGSACKRLNLFLRWMVRQDEVDPGGWKSVPASKLIVPLDTHMHRICSLLKFTRRKQAALRTAIEITDVFRTIAPNDPVKYDFALTRLGIRDDTDLGLFLERCDIKKENRLKE